MPAVVITAKVSKAFNLKYFNWHDYKNYIKISLNKIKLQTDCRLQ